MNNIIENHISKTQKRLKRYCSIILKSKYDRNVCEELIQTYIDARYYNFGVDEKIRVFYRRIYEALKIRANNLVKKEKANEENVENTLMLFQYFFYFDFVRKNIEISEVVKKIAEKRVNKFNLKSAEDDDFENTFTKIVETDMNEVNELLNGYNSDEFELEINKIVSSDNTFYRAKLKYNFAFPDVFSKDAIEDTFNEDIVNEDKLFVEYPMIAIKALKDILDGNFTKTYVIDFSTDLFAKKKKLEQLLTILNCQASQDKISFEINYNNFCDNKDSVYELTKRGFTFCLRTEKDMPKLTEDELKILNIFNCIIVDTYDINKKKYKKLRTLEV